MICGATGRSLRKGRDMTEQSLAHMKWDCVYHIVWIPKYRRKVLYYRAIIYT